MNTLPIKYVHAISSPFAVNDREKFLVWARALGLRVQAVQNYPLDRVVILPPADGEWHYVDVPEDVELSQDNGFWAWFAEELAKFLFSGHIVTLYDAYADEHASGGISWVDGAVHIIGSHGGYAYGELSDLVHHVLLGQEWPLGQVDIFSAGPLGVSDGVVTLPDPTTPKTMQPEHNILVLRRSDLKLRDRDVRFEVVGPEHLATTRDVYDNAQTVVLFDGVRTRFLKGEKPACKASSFHDGFRGVTQEVIDGLLISTFPGDDVLGIKSGTLICHPWTEEDSLACALDEDVLGATVSREDDAGETIMFRDIGVFIPEPHSRGL